MSVMPVTSAQAPAKTSNVAVRVRKNRPLTQKASQTIRLPLRLPLIRPSHHTSFKGRSVNA
jgi:hypothetical protein